MATGTIILRPSADKTVGHTKSSGSLGWSLIADVTPDDDSTYIYQTLSNKSNTSTNSIFILTGTIPTEKINITNVKLYMRARIGTNDETGSCICYFAVNSENGGSSSNAAVSNSSLSTSYVTSNNTSSTLVTQLNEYINTNNTFPTVSVKITSTGAKDSGKNASNGYIRITQVYMEVDYEIIETSKIYLKENGNWKEYSKVYIKENDNWVEKSMDQISSIFSTTANYVKSS